MKILIINTVPTGRNGITNVIFNYLKFTSTSDIIFDYVSINNPDHAYYDIFKKKRGQIYVLERTGKKIFSYIKSLKHIIKENHYDAVHIHANSHTSVVELLAAKLGGCEYRFVHAHSTNCGNIVIHNILSPIFNTLCTGRLACSNMAGVFMFGDIPYKVINNGVDTEFFAFNSSIRLNVRQRLNLNQNEILIGHIGYFLELKNQKFLVGIFNELLKNDGKYKLMLIGDGPLRETVEKQVDDNGLRDNVYFTGNIDNVVDYINAMDLVVMPSLFEGLPLTLIEQQTNGLHCICADTITREVDKTGNLTFLSLADGAKKWAEVIENIPAHYDRETYSEKARQDIKIAGYSIQEEANKLIHYYKSTIKQ